MARSLYALLNRRFGPPQDGATRRDFLKLTLASGAGLLLSNLDSAAQGRARARVGKRVIVVGAGLAGLAASISQRVPVPVICSVEAGVLAISALMRLKLSRPAMGSHARTPPVESIGLDPALAALLGGAAFPG